MERFVEVVIMVMRLPYGYGIYPNMFDRGGGGGYVIRTYQDYLVDAREWRKQQIKDKKLYGQEMLIHRLVEYAQP